MAAPVTFETFQQELASLVARFDREHPHFTNPDYNEAMVRADFLDPFFRALGWDVGNSKGLIHTEREVDIEVRTALSGRQTRADYVFRIARVERFTCEAKKPAETLHAGHIYQAKRDAFARGIPIAVLSDFEELKLYIVGSRPRLSEPHVGEYKKLHFRQYLAAARELWDLLAYENVAAGSIDRLIDSLPKRALKMRGRQGYLIKPDRTKSLDADFLNLLDEARRALGSDLLKYNDRADLLTGHRLNEAAQRIIDRLVFLRICEDRGIDTGGLLDSLLNGWLRERRTPFKFRRETSQSRLAIQGNGVHEDPGAYGAGSRAQPSEGGLYRELVEHVRSLDQRPPSYKPFFNGQLFKPHFSEELTVGDDFLANFIDELTDDDRGYNFADIKVEILGSAYERFLGNILLPQGRGVKIEEKPEVRKAGGVYYTPRYIVDYIVEQTVARQLAGKSPKEVAKLRFLDPACGSGSFLLRVYERVMEHYLRWFMDNPAKQTKADCYLDAAGNVRLTTQLKRRILLENVYGVDLDAQAVEVSQLSLYLKMLEGENRESLRAQTELFEKEPLLPALDKNILCGNSIIGADGLALDDIEPLSAFDWDYQFPRIHESGGFDCVIGNPPYLNVDDTWGKNDPRLSALKHQYPEVYADKTDLLFYFLAKSKKLAKGRVGMIVSRAFLEAFKATRLRAFLSQGNHVESLVDFKNYHVFSGVGISTCILFLDNSRAVSEIIAYNLIQNTLSPAQRDTFRTTIDDSTMFQRVALPADALGGSSWSFKPQDIAQLNSKIDTAGKPLEDILHIGQGMQTGANEVFGERTLSEMRSWRVASKFYRFRATNSDIRRYAIRDREEVLLYVEDVESFHDLPQGLQNHFHHHESKLKDRAAYQRENCDWWRYTWPLHASHYSKPRLIAPFLSTENRFALVEDGRYLSLTDTTVLFDNGQSESLKYLLGLLNSRLLTFRFRSIGKLKGGEMYEYFWNSVSKLPIRRINFENKNERQTHDRLVELVDRAMQYATKLLEAETTPEGDSLTSRHEVERTRNVMRNALGKTDRDIDQLVYQLYGLTPEEIALVEGTS